jgi:hypothetical protein
MNNKQQIKKKWVSDNPVETRCIASPQRLHMHLCNPVETSCNGDACNEDAYNASLRKSGGKSQTAFK